MWVHPEATCFPTSSSRFPKSSFLLFDNARSYLKWFFSSKMPDHLWNYFSDHLSNDFREVQNVVKFMQGPHVATNVHTKKHPSCVWDLLCLQLEFFAYKLQLFAYSAQLLLISTLMDSKQRSSTVSKKAPAVSKKDSPIGMHYTPMVQLHCCMSG